MEGKQHNSSMEITEAFCCLDLANHGGSGQSERLQVTLSGLNKRMDAMVTLLKENGKSSGPVQISRKTSLELIEMLEEFNRSYCSLAEKYDQLRINSETKPSASGTINKNRQDSSTREDFDSYHHCIGGDSDAECDVNKSGLQDLNKLADELTLTKRCKNRVKMNREDQTDKEVEDFSNSKDTEMDNDQNPEDLLEAYGKNNSWSEFELQWTQLMEENLQLQAELAKRNIEKKVAVNRLHEHVEHLQGENMALHNCISSIKIGEKQNHSRMPRFRGLFSGKFFKGGCS